MTDKLTPTDIQQLEALARTMPSFDDFIVEEYRKDPEMAKLRIADELEEYAQTGEMKYLLTTLKDVAAAKGWVQLAKEANMSRTTLYDTLNGRKRPRLDTLEKILRVLGFRMLFVAIDNTKATTKTPRKRTTAARTKKQEKQLQHA